MSVLKVYFASFFLFAAVLTAMTGTALADPAAKAVESKTKTMSETAAEKQAPQKAIETAAQGSAKQDTAKAEPSKDGDADERDYYTRRAQEMLEEDKAEDSKPHPLAANYPEHFVVVCEGGCKNRRAHVVDFEPRKGKQPIEIGEMIPTAAGGEHAASLTNVIQCLGGCRDDGGIYFDAAGVSAVEDDWDILEAHAPAKSQPESGRWLSQ